MTWNWSSERRRRKPSLFSENIWNSKITAQRITGSVHKTSNNNRENLYYGQYCRNFLAILSLMANHDPNVTSNISRRSLNAKYTHHSIHYALISTMENDSATEKRWDQCCSNLCTFGGWGERRMKAEQNSVVFTLGTRATLIKEETEYRIGIAEERLSEKKEKWLWNNPQSFSFSCLILFFAKWLRSDNIQQVLRW